MSDLSKSNMTLPEDRIKQLESENAGLREAMKMARQNMSAIAANGSVCGAAQADIDAALKEVRDE